MIDFSFSHDDALKADGYQPIRVAPPRRTRAPVTGDLSPRIWGRGGRLVVTTRPMETRAGTSKGPVPLAQVQQAFEKELARLIRLLARCREVFGSGPLRVVLCGGGTLRLPDWFLHQAAALGVRIDVSAPTGALETIQEERPFEPGVLRHIMEGHPRHLIGRRFHHAELPSQAARPQAGEALRP